MVDGGQHDVMADECALVDGDAALILELAAHVDEHPFTNDGVLAAVGMKRREHAYRLGHLSSPKLLQQWITRYTSLDISRLLRDRSLSFTDISDMFGFSSLSHFSRYVQTNLGAKPSDFRE